MTEHDTVRKMKGQSSDFISLIRHGGACTKALWRRKVPLHRKTSISSFHRVGNFQTREIWKTLNRMMLVSYEPYNRNLLVITIQTFTKNWPLFGLNGNCPPKGSCVWIFDLQLVALLCKAVKPLGYKVLLEEMGHWEWVLIFYITSLPVHFLFSDCEYNVTSYFQLL